MAICDRFGALRAGRCVNRLRVTLQPKSCPTSPPQPQVKELGISIEREYRQTSNRSTILLRLYYGPYPKTITAPFQAPVPVLRGSWK